MKQNTIIRQGDVLLQLVPGLPAGCTVMPTDKGRIVLAYGEATGHAHVVVDYTTTASEITEAAIAHARAKARLWKAPNGERFLEVEAPVALKHEEHSQHVITPGIYRLPTQMEYTPAELRKVED